MTASIQTIIFHQAIYGLIHEYTLNTIYESSKKACYEGDGISRMMYDLVRNLNMRTSMLVDCSVPTIYYGARTHKQLQQVIKEFGRTVYCKEIAMTVLSSRDNSCLREFDREIWKTREDMCKNCIKVCVKMCQSYLRTY